MTKIQVSLIVRVEKDNGLQEHEMKEKVLQEIWDSLGDAPDSLLYTGNSKGLLVTCIGGAKVL